MAHHALEVADRYGHNEVQVLIEQVGVSEEAFLASLTDLLAPP